MTPTVLALLTLAIGVPLNVYVTVVLRRLHREQASPVLRVLIVSFASVLVLATVFGVIFLFNDGLVPIPFLDVAGTKWITRAIVLGIAVIPALVLLLWLHGGPPPTDDADPTGAP